jgi:hypothetical protein
MNRSLPRIALLSLALALMAALSPAQTPGADVVGQPWSGGKGITESVQQIMQRELSVPTIPFDGILHDRDEFPQRPTPSQNPAAQMTSSWPPLGKIQPSPDRQTFLNPQVLGANFPTITSSESPYIPPDCGADVGPTQVLIHLNGRIKVFNKAGVLGALNAADTVFWSSVRGGQGVSDPHIRYDRLTKRWILVIINTASTNNRVMIAVSSDSVITGTGSFTFFQFAHNAVGGGTSDNNGFADYPTLGVDANALYIGVNVFNAAGTSVVGTTAFVVRKSALLTGSLVVTAFRQLTNGNGTTGFGPWTPQGCDNDDPAATEGYFIGVDFVNYGTLDIRRISSPGGTPTISGNIQLTVPTTYAPILQPHLGEANANRKLDALDDRLFAAQVKKDKLTGVTSLWTAHNISVNTSGVATTVAGTRNASRWYQIGTLTGTPTLLQSGTLFDAAASNPRGYWIPTVAMSGQGHMALGSSYAGLLDHAGVAVAGRLSSDPLGTIQSPTLALVSTTSYNVENTDGQRWGDYSSTVVDPSDDMTFWTFQEYCDAANSWGMRAVQLRAPLPAAPTSASPSTVVAGTSNVSVTITGTSSGGTGFFDPGAGYSSRISASVGGAGVTVNSVTFTSPTSITLNLTIAAGATSGARTVTVTNPDGQSATSASGILTVSGASCPTITLSPSTLPAGAAGVSYSQTITSSGGTGPYTYAVTSGALPAGLTLASGGGLTGIPTFGGSYNFSVTATDANFCTGVQAYTLSVTGCPQITLAPATLPNDTIGVAYSQTVTASGGTPSYTYIVSAGALPSGLTLSAGGAITGAASAAGTFNFTVQATDAGSCVGTRAYSIQVVCAPITVAPATLPSDTVGKAYSQNITASGGTPAYTYTVSSGSLPTGLTLSTGGLLSGTTSAAGVYSFTVLATDGIGCTGSRAYSVTIYAVVVPNTVSLTTQGTAVIQNFDSLASTGSTASTLPTGWLFGETGGNQNTTYGVDNGANTAGNTYSYGATSSTDRAFGGLQSGSLTPTIGASVTNNTGATITSLAIAYVGEQWRLGTLSRTDSLLFQMSTDATSLTTGAWTSYPQLHFWSPIITGTTGAKDGNSAGFRTTKSATITGLSIPNGAEFFIRWTDFNATSADDGLAVDSVAITANPGGGSPTNPTASGASSPASVVVGNTSLLTVTVTPGTNPASTGITVAAALDSIGGSHTQQFFNDGTNGDVTNGDNIWSYRATVGLGVNPGAKSFPVTVTDAQARNAAASIGLTVLACPTITVLPATLPNAGLGVAYGQQLSSTGGTAPYSYALQTPNTLPAGLSLSGSGLISGTATAAGVSNFTVVVTDSNGCGATKGYAITVTCPSITVTPASTPAATISAAYSQQLSASGGATPYAFSLQVPDVLPAGLTLSGAGLISGIPTATGTTNFTVIATDSNGCTGTKAYSIQVSCPAITITPATVPAGTIGAAYSQSLSGSGGKPPYAFSVGTGTLPAGLTLSPAGLISGTPTANGTSNFTVVAADSNGCLDSLGYALTIGCPTITITPASLSSGVVGTPYAHSLSASGGTGSKTFAVTAGALPAGLTLSGAGAISGTPTAAGTDSFTVTATDSLGCTGTRLYVLQIACPTITMAPASLSSGTKDSSYAQQIGASGGTAQYAYQVTLGAIPSGMTLSTAGLLSGTPGATGGFSFTVSATDTFGCTGTKAYALQINCPAVTVLPATLADDSVAHAISTPLSAAGGTGPYTFTVTSGALPSGVTLSTGGVLGGAADTPGSYSFTVSAVGTDLCGGSRAYTWQINPSSDVIVHVPVQAQWNIVSNPIEGGASAVTSLYPTAVSSAFAFIPSTGYNATASMAPGLGYWLKFGASGTATLQGMPLLDDSVSVAAGWNLVGSLAQPIAAASVSPVGTRVISQFFRYQTGYVVADSLLPGHGYWVNVSAPGALHFSSGAAAAAMAPHAAPEVSALASIVVTDAAGNSQELSLARPGLGMEGSFFALPPAPPKGVFDVRFTSDRMTEFAEPGRRQEFTIHVASASAPLTVRWKRSESSDERMVLYGVDGSKSPLRAELEGEGSVTVRSAQNLRVIVEPKRVIPSSYALLQNYPNPFNPVTTLQFDLPARSSVTLVVMNILGEEVARLYDREDLGPGREEVSFDASRLASGIYFYRLTARGVASDGAAAAASYSSTRKMILVK